MAMKIMFLSLPLSAFARVAANMFESTSDTQALDRATSMPHLFTSQRYGAWSSQMAMPMNGECQMLKSTDDLYHNVGSIYIPCASTAGKKAMCTMYSDSNCQDMMVEFDRSHYRLFDRSHGNTMQTTYLGGMVESVKCEMVDVSTEVSNNNGHVSTMHMSQCVGDKCSSNRECHLNLGGHLFCSENNDMTCQMGRFLTMGSECTEDNQCREGYCTNMNGQMKCMPKRALDTLCSSSAECVSNGVCCDLAGGSRCSRDLCHAEVVNDDMNMCMSTAMECSEDSMCCSGSWLEGKVEDVNEDTMTWTAMN
ncbi:uncharacterized protein N7484_005410 [Penicillium longicatenatum]|uniref:uncharacterized protein n=1 Tax=Penicillium longicatenatum TaxID=1561947 RepID=UPI00254689F8|nr:uncharacterized protein N7484_005410 [Penicillium longicatenatum]KAJ5642903.1 hypothetical protein N7484_005410 [Penicillium longicatenatum]